MSSLPVLVLNSGSSSIKFSVYEAGDGQRRKLFEGAVDGIGTDLGKFWIKDADGKKLVDQTPALPNRAVAFKLVADALHSGDFPAPAAIGHRMVCGGPTVQENQLITPELIDEMEATRPLRRCTRPSPSTSCARRCALSRHSQLSSASTPTSIAPCPRWSRTCPSPRSTPPWACAATGYHGISYESIVYQLQPNVPEKLIVAHLGNGASISAIRNGKCLDTSMGLTPTGGIISGTRTGDIDPGVLLFILRKIAETTKNANRGRRQAGTVASKKAGLLGVSELSNDMRDLRDAINAGNAKARLAVDKFTWTIARGSAALWLS
jgi:acetate kinase